MQANFYPELTLKDDGRTVDVAGPLNWDRIPPQIERVTVIAVVSQNGVEGRSASREYRRGDCEREWWCEVTAEAGKTFRPGPAASAGAIHALDADGTPPWPWAGDPELVAP
jgi:hypothetical protein